MSEFVNCIKLKVCKKKKKGKRFWWNQEKLRKSFLFTLTEFESPKKVFCNVFRKKETN